MSLYNDASLLLIPSGYKSGKVYCQKPTDGDGDLTFTRASSATRVNSDGLIESVATGVPRLDYSQGSCPSLLLEPQRTNLVLYSEEFDNASWEKTNTTITANSTTSPDGNTTADKIVETTANGEHNVRQDSGLSVLSTTYTFSIYAKSSERSFLQFVGVSGIASSRANFNLSNGTLGAVDASINASIINAGNGWYRCIVTATSNSVGVLRNQWNIITSSTSARVERYTGDGTSGLFLWGAQLE
jgi:hypothetical protein